MKKYSLGLAIVALYLSQSAWSSVKYELCSADHDFYCKKIQPDSNEDWACLQKKFKKLNTSCKTQVTHHTFHEACAEEIKAHCANIESGNGNIHKCMSEAQQAAKLTVPACLSFLKKNSKYLNEMASPKNNHGDMCQQANDLELATPS